MDNKNKDLYKDLDLVKKYTDYIGFYFRKFKVKCESCVNKTEKEFQSSFPINGGTYFVKVFNTNNIGHYSLAIGEAEFFGSNLWEKILTWTPILLFIGPYMDIVHWQKFDIRAFIPHIALFVIIFIFYFIIKKIFFRKKRRYFAN